MKVRIYRPSKNAMQSGLGRTQTWILEYEATTRRGPEALMGWTASGDTLNQVRLKFETKDAAIAFAQAKGWNFTVNPEHDRIVRPRNYADNFKYVAPETTDVRKTVRATKKPPTVADETR
jgi:hypothetical protein